MGPCTVCGKAIAGRYRTNYWGETYCSEHEPTLPQCFTCHRIVSLRSTGGAMRYRDGRIMCNRCRQTAVTDPATVDHWLAQVRLRFLRLGLDLGTAPIPVELDDRDALARQSTSTIASQPLGLAFSTWRRETDGAWRKGTSRILIQDGLPAEQFAAVLAHELGHEWMYHKNFPDVPPVVEEGFCQLCKGLWLQERRTPEARYQLWLMAISPDPVYGEGYRLARRALLGRSVVDLAVFVRLQRRFPDPIPASQLLAGQR